MIVHVFATFLLDQGSKQLHRVPVEYKLHQQVEEVKAHFMDLSKQCIDASYWSNS